MAQWERIRLPMQEMWVRSLGQEDPPEKEMETHSSILAWRIPGTEEPGELQSTGSQELDTTEHSTASSLIQPQFPKVPLSGAKKIVFTLSASKTRDHGLMARKLYE